MKSIYNGSLSQAQIVSDLTKRNEAIAEQAGISANDSALYATAAKHSLIETRSIYNQTASASQKIMSLTGNNKTTISQVATAPNSSLSNATAAQSWTTETGSVCGLLLPWLKKSS